MFLVISSTKVRAIPIKFGT